MKASEAFRLGQVAMADRLTRYVQLELERLGRQYDALSPEQVAALEQVHEDSHHPPAVEAHFGAAGEVLCGVRAEVERLRVLASEGLEGAT